MKIQKELIEKVAELLGQGYDHRAIRDIIEGIHGRRIGLATISKIRHKIRKSKEQSTTPLLETKENFTDTSGEISVSKNNRITSLEELIEHCKIDLEQWDIDRHIINKWEVGAKDENGDIVTEPLFQVKARLRKKTQMSVEQQDRITLEVLSELGTKHLENIITELKTTPANRSLEICIFDAHINKLCQREVSGDERNHIIAEEAYLNMIDRMIERGQQERCNNVVLVVGNDFFQIDNLQRATTSGTRVDASTGLYPGFVTGQNIIIKAVDKLLQAFQHIHITMVGGNHDTTSTFYLGQVLGAWYRDVERVTVDNEYKSRKVVVFGNNMVMYAHGHNEKRKDYAILMATEYPELRAKTRYREVIIGHFHTQLVEEQHGVIVRVVNSISGTDKWHYDKGFIGNIRGGTAFVRDFENGLVGQFNFNLA